MLDPFNPVSPGVILFNSQAVNAILVRVKDNEDLKNTLATIDPIFKRYNAAQPFVYSFVDDDFNKKFKLENQVGKLAGIFAVLAIFISCLGLFGLASFMAEQRVKEIGIRKILGASVMNLWRMLSREFIVMIVLSLLIASPITYYFMEQWLQTYHYRTTLSGWVFVGVGGGIVMITLLTVSYHAVIAAIANPVKSLRVE
jgi:ABC-type antimicrobial peptide transport system permease subunit